MTPRPRKAAALLLTAAVPFLGACGDDDSTGDDLDPTDTTHTTAGGAGTDPLATDPTGTEPTGDDTVTGGVGDPDGVGDPTD